MYQFTAVAGGQVTKLGYHTGSGANTGTTSVQIAIVADDGANKPKLGAPLAEATVNASNPAENTLYEVAVGSGPTLVLGTKYWLCLLPIGGELKIKHTSAGTKPSYKQAKPPGSVTTYAPVTELGPEELHSPMFVFATGEAHASNREVSDTLMVGEAVSAHATQTRAVGDPVSLAESCITVQPKSVADSISLSETLSRRETLLREVVEGASHGGMGFGSSGFGSAPFGGAFLTTTPGLVLAETVVPTTRTRNVADELTLGETVTGLMRHIAAQTDPLLLADSVSRATVASRLLSESIKLEEALARALRYSRPVEDTLRVAEALSKGSVRLVSDPARIVESVNAQSLRTRLAADQLGLTETLSAGSSRQASATDILTLSDGVVAKIRAAYLGPVYVTVETPHTLPLTVEIVNV
jgi:hypothetical protein